MEKKYKFVIRAMQLLLSKRGVVVNSLNSDGLAALDVLSQRNPNELSVIDEIGKILENAGAIRARVAPITQSSNTPNCLKNKSSEKNHSTWVRERWGA